MMLSGSGSPNSLMSPSATSWLSGAPRRRRHSENRRRGCRPRASGGARARTAGPARDEVAQQVHAACRRRDARGEGAGDHGVGQAELAVAVVVIQNRPPVVQRPDVWATLKQKYTAWPCPTSRSVMAGRRRSRPWTLSRRAISSPPAPSVAPSPERGRIALRSRSAGRGRSDAARTFTGDTISSGMSSSPGNMTDRASSASTYRSVAAGVKASSRLGPAPPRSVTPNKLAQPARSQSRSAARPPSTHSASTVFSSGAGTSPGRSGRMSTR